MNESSVYPFNIEVVNDGTTTNENRLGAIADIQFVIEQKSINDDLLVAAGDNIFQFDFEKFYAELKRLNNIGAKWILTFDGVAGKRSYSATIPPDLYKVQLGLPTGNSPFTKLMKTSLDSVVESVFLNFEPSPKALSQVMNFG
jgi:hypothetical protein